MTLLGMATLITACGTTGTYIGYSNTGDLPSDYIQPSKSVIKAKNPATNESQVMYLTQESVDRLNSNQETELKFFFTEHKPNEDSQPDLTIQFNPNTDNFDPTDNDKDNYALKFDKRSGNLYGIVQDENRKLHALGATSIPASDGAMAQNFKEGVEATYSVDAIALMDKNEGLDAAQSGKGKFRFTFDSIVEGGTGAFEGDIDLDNNGPKLEIVDGKIHDGAFESTIKGDGKTANLDGIFTGKEAEGITGGWEGDEMLGAFSGKRD